MTRSTRPPGPTRPALRLDGVEAGLARRMAQTVACADSDDLPKVDDAGQDRVVDGTTVQVMHNGLLVEKGGYFGDWMAEIIRALRGHHEPQEELVFDALLRRLNEDTTAPTMIELGSFWLYYGLWFLSETTGSRVVAIEPDPSYMGVGVRNAALNGLTDRVTFVEGAVGAEPGAVLDFPCEGLGGAVRPVTAYDLASLMRENGLEHVDLVLCDVQGAETILLDRARGDLAAGRVRFLLVSTHHHDISGHPLTHQDALRLLEAAGAHVVAEHGVSESCSGDGLIAVSFDPRDADLRVPVSHVRSKDSLFGETEYAVATALDRLAATEEERRRLEVQRDDLQRRGEATAADLAAELARARAELAAVTSTKAWRVLAGPRRLYGRVLTRRAATSRPADSHR